LYPFGGSKGLPMTVGELSVALFRQSLEARL
jgi:hypothetical protein